jgi:hypothetical protein
VSYDDCEIPEFYSEDFPVAAKEHRCCECRAPINVGEKHLYCRMKYDGEFQTYRQHMLCRELCMLIRDNGYGDCVYFGGLRDEIEAGEYLTGYGKADYPEERRLWARIIRREGRALKERSR